MGSDRGEYLREDARHIARSWLRDNAFALYPLVKGKNMHAKDNPKFSAVFQPRNPVQAGMVREALDQAGINCYVENETFAGVRMGGIGLGAGSMRVMVPENQVERAKAIIDGLGME